MSAMAERLKEKYFKEDHPYRIFEREVERYLRPHCTLLDAGCGRTAPILAKFKGRAHRLVGIDVTPFASRPSGMELMNGDLGDMPLESSSVDVVMSRSVME